MYITLYFFRFSHFNQARKCPRTSRSEIRISISFKHENTEICMWNCHWHIMKFSVSFMRKIVYNTPNRIDSIFKNGDLKCKLKPTRVTQLLIVLYKKLCYFQHSESKNHCTNFLLSNTIAFICFVAQFVAFLLKAGVVTSYEYCILNNKTYNIKYRCTI